MGKLQGKIAIVTGASKGIGAAIAKAFAAEGAAVVVGYASSREGANRVVADIEKQGGRAVAVGADVAKVAEVRQLFAETRRIFEGVDILVNNAAVYKFEPLEALTEAEFHRQFDTNVLGPIIAIQEAARAFGPQGGSIINISTVAATSPVPTSTIYSASKGALETVTRALALELAPRKIRVNTIAPGMTETEGLIAAGIKGSEFEKNTIAATPLGRSGQPEDIAKVAVFLASDDSAWVTGDRITASGGLR